MSKRVMGRILISLLLVSLLFLGFTLAFGRVAIASIRIDSIIEEPLWADPDFYAVVAQDAEGEYSGVVRLSATLTNNGNPVSDKEIVFTLNNTSYVGAAFTNSFGIATLTGVSLTGLSVDKYPEYIEATFTDHSTNYRGLADLTVKPKEVLVTPDPGQSKDYGTADPPFAFTNDAGLSISDFTGALSREPGETVNNFAFTLGNLSAGSNYALALSGSNTFAIIKATPAFSNLTSPTINFGTPSINLGGSIKLGSLIPTGNIQITVADTTHGTSTDITPNAAGDFLHNVDTSSLATGTYPITYYFLGDSNFNSLTDNTKTLMVVNSNATITLSNLNQTYDGQPKWADFATNPPGLTASVTYNGSTTPPTNAGSYSITASITSTGYTGSANDTFTITKITPAFTNLSSPAITQGTVSTVLGGNIKSGDLIPSGNVAITLNGITLQASINPTTGDFGSSFDTSALIPAASYPITYRFNGDTNFNLISDNTFSLTVTPAGTPSPTPTNPPASGGGGGGGGGIGGSITPSGFSSNARLEINSSGLILSEAKLTTPDGKATLDIPYRTKLLSELGNPLAILTVFNSNSPPAPPSDHALVLAYTFGPEGAKFDPPINLMLSYESKTLPEGFQESSLFIAFWDGSQWIPLESIVDTAADTVSVSISHFSTYSLLGELESSAPSPASTPPPVSTPDNSPIPSSTASPEIPPTATAGISATPNIPEPPQTTNPTPIQDATQTPPFSTLIIIYVAVFIVVASLTVLLVSRYQQGHNRGS